MTLSTVPVLLARCQAFGIDLSAGPSGALYWEADDDPPAALLADLAEHKAAVLAVLLGMICDSCRQPLDGKGRCWRCCDRRCHCGRPTGSAFIELCCICGNNDSPGR